MIEFSKDEMHCSGENQDEIDGNMEKKEDIIDDK